MRSLQKRRPSLSLEALEARNLLTSDLLQVGYFDTWNGAVPSSDPAGITYHSGNLYISDSEINEIPAYQGNNVFEVDPSGSPLVRAIDGNNSEPTGITFNEFDGFFYVTNDNTRKIIRYDSSFDTKLFTIFTSDDDPTALDPEGITSNPANGMMYVVDGKDGGMQVLTYDSTLTYQSSFSVDAYMDDAEGIALNPENNHLYIVSSPDDTVFEFTTSGTFIGSLELDNFSPAPLEPQGLTFAPTSDTSDDPDALALYIADAMVDNFEDGRIYEAVLVDAPPESDAGPDSVVYESTSASLQGSATPGASVSWTKVSGPGSVNFANPSSAVTTATFSAKGNYVLRLTANDGPLSSSDDMSATVIEPINVNSQLVFAVQSGATLPGGLRIANEDLAFYDGSQFTLLFDGSDVGLHREQISAFSVIDDDEYLFSLSSTASLPGITGTVDDSDIVKFNATQLGSGTAGSFEMYFDGSDVGLTQSTEDIDAFALLSDGSLLISTLGSPNVPGVSAKDEDVLLFTPSSLGNGTSGSWELYIDSGDVGLSGDLNGLEVGPYDELYFTMQSDFSVAAVSGENEDVAVFKPSVTGANTTGGFASPLWFDGSSSGLSASDLRGISIVPSSLTDAALSATVTCESYIVFNKGTNLGGFTAANEDIVCFDGSGFSRIFDGSDVGLNTSAIDGLAFLSSNEILMSFTGASSVPGLSTVDDSDIVKFTASSLGDSTNGSFSWYFDGSDVGLTTNSEDIDGIDVMSDGRIMISTLGSASVPGAATARDEDILEFTPTSIGSNTSGSWSMHFDGSDVIDASEDVDALSLDEGNLIYLSMFDAFTAGGISGADNDIIEFAINQTGDTTTGTWQQLLFDASAFGVPGSDIRAIDIVTSASSAPLAAAIDLPRFNQRDVLQIPERLDGHVDTMFLHSTAVASVSDEINFDDRDRLQRRTNQTSRRRYVPTTESSKQVSMPTTIVDETFGQWS